jgi:hypothetical protein
MRVGVRHVGRNIIAPEAAVSRSDEEHRMRRNGIAPYFPASPEIPVLNPFSRLREKESVVNIQTDAI